MDAEKRNAAGKPSGAEKQEARIFGENAGLFPEGAAGLTPKRKPEGGESGGGFGKDAGLFEPGTDGQAGRQSS